MTKQSHKKKKLFDEIAAWRLGATRNDGVGKFILLAIALINFSSLSAFSESNCETSLPQNNEVINFCSQQGKINSQQFQECQEPFTDERDWADILKEEKPIEVACGLCGHAMNCGLGDIGNGLCAGTEESFCGLLAEELLASYLVFTQKQNEGRVGEGEPDEAFSGSAARPATTPDANPVVEGAPIAPNPAISETQNRPDPAAATHPPEQSVRPPENAPAPAVAAVASGLAEALKAAPAAVIPTAIAAAIDRKSFIAAEENALMLKSLHAQKLLEAYGAQDRAKQLDAIPVRNSPDTLKQVRRWQEAADRDLNRILSGDIPNDHSLAEAKRDYMEHKQKYSNLVQGSARRGAIPSGIVFRPASLGLEKEFKPNVTLTSANKRGKAGFTIRGLTPGHHSRFESFDGQLQIDNFQDALGNQITVQRKKDTTGQWQEKVWIFDGKTHVLQHGALDAERKAQIQKISLVKSPLASSFNTKVPEGQIKTNLPKLSNQPAEDNKNLFTIEAVTAQAIAGYLPTPLLARFAQAITDFVGTPEDKLPPPYLDDRIR
ncbi:MAG: hypothetical protein HY401_04885 [Elusimicrobia bacterium]|nr:hypothetical protein [Elusimicrobiota bacterium]